MTGKQITWHLVRLALAVAPLAYDIRVFLFYAFTILLAVASDIDPSSSQRSRAAFSQ